MLSYFNNIVFDVLVNGFEKVKLFCLLVNNVSDVVFRLLIDVVWPFINPYKLVDVVFKFVICVVWPFINPNNDDNVVVVSPVTLSYALDG